MRKSTAVFLLAILSMAALAVYGSFSAPALNSEPLIVRGDDVVDIRSARYVQDGSIILQENGTLMFSDTKLVMYQVYRSHHVEVNGTARLILERSDLHYISDTYNSFPGPTIYVKENGTIRIHNSTVTYIIVKAYGYSNVEIVVSNFWSYGFVFSYDNANVTILDSYVNKTWF